MLSMIGWAVIAGGAFVMRMWTGALNFLIVSVAAGITALYAASAPSAWLEMLIVFGVVAGGQMLYYKKRPPPEITEVPHEGSHVEVTAELEEGLYRVRFQGAEWPARLTEAPPVDADGGPLMPRVLKVKHIDGDILLCGLPDELVD